MICGTFRKQHMVSFYNANLINAWTLIVVSIWTYLDAIDPEIKMFGPCFVGVALLVLNNGILYYHRGQAYTATFLTLVLLFFLFKPIFETWQTRPLTDYYREIIMIMTCVFSLFVFFIKFVFISKVQKK